VCERSNSAAQEWKCAGAVREAHRALSGHGNFVDDGLRDGPAELSEHVSAA
jgi:hypothetical protein